MLLKLDKMNNFIEEGPQYNEQKVTLTFCNRIDCLCLVYFDACIVIDYTVVLSMVNSLIYDQLALTLEITSIMIRRLKS